MPELPSSESEVLIARAVPEGEPQVLIARARREQSQAAMAMTLAALSWIIAPVVCSLPGLILARREIAAIRAGRRAERHLAMARNAYWISVLNLFVSLVFAAVTVYVIRSI
jgi:hypothetical protein